MAGFKYLISVAPNKLKFSKFFIPNISFLIPRTLLKYKWNEIKAIKLKIKAGFLIEAL